MKFGQAVLFIPRGIAFLLNRLDLILTKCIRMFWHMSSFFPLGHGRRGEESRGRNYPFDDNIYFPAGPRLSVIDRRHR